MVTLSPPALAGATAPLAKPLAVKLTDVKFADGAVASEAEVTLAGILVFRGAPGAAELWDEGQKTWRPAPADAELATAKPLVAVFKPGPAPSWEATLVAIGQKDAADAPSYKAAQNGAPAYFARGQVKTRRGGVDETTVGPPSATFTFTSGNPDSRFVTEFQTAETEARDAERVRMQLKGSGLQTAGYLEIRAQPNFEVEIANCDGAGNVLAKVLLAANGDIRLAPGAGGRVIVDADLECQRLLYQPSGGGSKQWLGP